MASPIYVKVKSEFSLKKKGKYTGRELHGHDSLSDSFGARTGSA